MAIRSNGSIQSTSTGASFPAKTTPGPISTFSATPSSATQMDLSWSAPSSNGNDTVTGYKVEHAVTSVGSYTVFAANQAGTTAAITGLTNGTNYTFRITPINSVGNGQANTFTATLKFGLGTLTYQEFTSTGTWTCPAGVTKANLILVGGGGGGGSDRRGQNGSGSDVKTWLDVSVTPSTGYTVTIGARGTNSGSAAHGGNTTVVIGGTTYTSHGAPGGFGSIYSTSMYYDNANLQNGAIGGAMSHISPIGNTQLIFPAFNRAEQFGAGWGTGGAGAGNPFNGASDAPQGNYWYQPTGGSNYGAGGSSASFNGMNPPGGATGTAASGYGNGGAWNNYGSAGIARIYWYA
jgi:hypothetical protein